MESDDPGRAPVAAALAEETGLPLRARAAPQDALLIAVCDDRLEVRENRRGARGIYVDFVGGATGFRRRTGLSRRQPIAKAVDLRGNAMTVFDATAGLGRDAFLLACLGCTVTAAERSPVLAALLRDGLARARASGLAALARIVARMSLVDGDSRALLAALPPSEAPDVVYVDPMFSSRRKETLAKKEMRICRALVGDDTDAAELVAVSRRIAQRRVVVKRHRLAEPLAGSPDIEYAGKQVRYDVYLARP